MDLLDITAGFVSDKGFYMLPLRFGNAHIYAGADLKSERCYAIGTKWLNNKRPPTYYFGVILIMGTTCSIFDWAQYTSVCTSFGTVDLSEPFSLERVCDLVVDLKLRHMAVHNV